MNFFRGLRLNLCKHIILFLLITIGTITISNAQQRADTIVQNPQTFEGKIIRNIVIENGTFFEIALQDSIAIIARGVETARFLHINTHDAVIRKLLLFRENDQLDALRLRESERLVRSQRYIDHASIEIVPIAGSADSVDVRVFVHDAFSLIPEGQISTSRIGVGLRANNLLGTGHQIRGFYTWRRDNGLSNYVYSYDIPNVANTYINANVQYRRNLIDTTNTKRLSLQRPFYSIFTRWAGGVTLMQQSQMSNVFLPDEVEPVVQRLQFNEQDYWAAHALQLSRRESRKLIVSSRYYRINYTEKPLSEFDPLQNFSTENLYLLGFGFSERTFRRDRYLFKFGVVEDVPVGQMYNFVGGIQNKNGQNRLYLGTNLSRGQYFSWGYLEMSVNLGSFVSKSNIEEGVFRGELNYFTPLIELNDWKIRAFFRPQLVLGFNRLATDRITLNDYFDISGFNSVRPFGTKKIVGHLQTNIYSPYSIWNFKIGGYLSYSMGMLGNDDDWFSHSTVYSALGFGLLFRNDRLGFNSIRIGISYFPFVPEAGYHILKVNLYESQNFRYHDFDINKPDMIRYQ